MSRIPTVLTMILVAAVTGPMAASGQGRPDPQKVMAAQREALNRLAFMDGTWRGPAWTLLPSGEKHTLTQTERVGPFLDGGVRVVQGRGYEEDGSVGFNALGIISYDPRSEGYSMRSYAMGNAGDFDLAVTDHGFTWEIPAGPMTIRYEATIGDGSWSEVGTRISPGRDPVRFFEMTLTRVGDTDWPEAGMLGPE